VNAALANISETCAIVNRLEKDTIARLGWDGITPRQLRYLEERDVLQPFRATFQRQTDGRLYSAESIVLVRIWLRLLVQAALPDWAARAALAYRRDELHRELQRGERTDAVLLMQGVRGVVVSESAAAKMTPTCKLPLVSAIRGVDDALINLRRAKPDIWTGRRLEAGSTLVTEVLRV
jgi:DNA-binding transcriptional MerR regulator